MNYLDCGRCVVAIVVAIVCSVPGQAATTWHVDDDACPGAGDGSALDPLCRVQDAIDLAVDGDVVSVAAGDYDEALDLLGKVIHVLGAEGPSVTTLRHDTGSVVTCTSGETLDTILEGFTVTGGTGTFATDCTGNLDQEGIFGGGMYVIDSSATVKNCVFVENGIESGDSIISGSAIYAHGGNLTIRDSTFVRNGNGGTDTSYGGAVNLCGAGRLTVTDSLFDSNGRGGTFGGGIFAYKCELTAERCLFTNNSASFGGGAFVLPSGQVIQSAQARVTECTFVDNFASQAGGLFAIAAEGAHVEITDCRFVDNACSASGGGAIVAGNNATALVDRCWFTGNVAHAGGGMDLSGNVYGFAKVANSVFVDNHAVGPDPDAEGGGLAVWAANDGSAAVVNITAIQNTADDSNGGVDVEIAAPLSTITIDNAILRDNLPNQIGGGGEVRHSNVQGGVSGPGNIDIDPRFVDVPSRNLRLLSDSPSIDAGIEDLVTETDFDNQPRVVARVSGLILGAPMVDMGAFEFPSGSSLVFGDDGATISWHQIGGAVSYNVYRGDLGSWSDADEDGLPDGGYGDCVTGDDPDSSDAFFVDSEEPPIGAGFFYLTTMVEHGGAEYFLGETSAGVARRIDVPCP